MKLFSLVRLIRPVLVLLAAALPAAAQQQVAIHDQLLNMNANYLTCPQGFRCEGTIIRNPISLDPQVVYSVIRQDGRSGFIFPAKLQTAYPATRMATAAGLTIMPFAPATDILKNVVLPKRVLPMFPGATVQTIQHKQECPRMQDQTDCAIAIIDFTSREHQPMEALIDTMCRYQRPGGNLQDNDVTFLITFAPKGQPQAAPSVPKAQVDANWHAREQQRARQFSMEYQQQVRQAMGQTVAIGQQQLALIHQYGDVVRQEDHRSQQAIDDVAQDEADTVGDRVTVHSWRNSSGEITHTDSNQSPGPGWVQIRQ